MSDLPPGWEWATLDDLAAPEPRAITDGPFGSNLKSNHYTDSGARVIRLQNIGDGDFRDDRAYVDLDRFEQLKAHEVREGDLVIASLGDSPPRACLVPRLTTPAIVKADCIRVRLSKHVAPEWVLYTLLSPATKSLAKSSIKGVGRPDWDSDSYVILPCRCHPQLSSVALSTESQRFLPKSTMPKNH